MEFTGQVSVAKWLSRLGEGTRSGAEFHLRRWMEYLVEAGSPFGGMTPDELVAHQRAAWGDENGRFDILDSVQTYVNSRQGTFSYKKSMYAYTRSFFMHNRAELPRDRGFIIRGDKPKNVGYLKPEEVRDVILSCNPVYRAIFLSMFQGGMGQSEFLEWNEGGWEDLRDQLRKNVNVVVIQLPGRKLNKNRHPFRTYVGGDTIDAIHSWLKIRPEGPGPIFIDQHGKSPSKKGMRTYWLRHLRKLGIVGPKTKGSDKGYRTGKSAHELRDTFRSQWEKSPATKSVSEFMMGHIVDKLEYNKAYKDEKWTLKEYRKALPMLEIMSSGKPFGLVDEDSVDDLQRTVADLTRTIGLMETQMQANALIVKMLVKKDSKVDGTTEAMKEPEFSLAKGG